VRDPPTPGWEVTTSEYGAAGAPALEEAEHAALEPGLEVSGVGGGEVCRLVEPEVEVGVQRGAEAAPAPQARSTSTSANSSPRSASTKTVDGSPSDISCRRS
jgi:hypothetical protein